MKNRKSPILKKIVLILVALFILVPIANLLVWVFTERWSWPDLLPQVYSLRALQEILENKEFLIKTLLSSVLISGVVAVLSVAIAIMTARALTLYEFKGKGLFQFLSILPFLVPATVFAMGIHVSFIRWGLSNNLLGVILSHTICSLPYAVQLLSGGIKAVGTGLEEQARVLGASAWKAFFKVTLPLLTPGILSGMSMAFVVSLSQYFLTLLIGGGQVQTFAVVMVPYLQGGYRNISSVYSIIFLTITLVVFAVLEWVIEKINKNIKVEYY